MDNEVENYGVQVLCSGKDLIRHNHDPQQEDGADEGKGKDSLP